MYCYRVLACISALLGFAVAGCPASLAQDRTKFVYYFTPSSNVAPVFLAKEKGYFDEVGLDVELAQTPTGVRTVELLHLGQIQAGNVAAIVLINGVAKGLKVVAVEDNGGYDARNPQQALLVKKDVAINSIADLRGKRVAVNAFGAHGHVVMLSEVLPAAGLKKDDVRFVEMSWPQMIPSIISGAIDAGLVWEPFVTTAPADIRNLSSLKETMPKGDYPDVGYAAAIIAMNPEYVAKNPKMVAAWHQAYLKGLKHFRDNVEDGHVATAKYLKVSVDVLRKSPLNHYTADGLPPRAIIQHAADQLKELGFLDNPVDMSKHIVTP
jgi:NitT/TauT family transport system substrate-binding protein